MAKIAYKTAWIQDKWNPSKTWAIKRTNCRHYKVTQLIDGWPLYGYKRVTRAWLETVLEVNLDEAQWWQVEVITQ